MTKLPSYIAGLNEMKTVNVLFPLEKVLVIEKMHNGMYKKMYRGIHMCIFLNGKYGLLRIERETNKGISFIEC